MSDDESRQEHLPTEGGEIFTENGSETVEGPSAERSHEPDCGSRPGDTADRRAGISDPGYGAGDDVFECGPRHLLGGCRRSEGRDAKCGGGGGSGNGHSSGGGAGSGAALTRVQRHL